MSTKMYKAYSGDVTLEEESENKTCGRKCLKLVKANLLLIFLLLGIVSGIVIGVVIRASDKDFRENERHVMYLSFPGELFLRMLKCCIIPMIVTSLIAGMAAIPGQAAGRMGAIAVIYYMTTTFLAVILGILLVSTIKPGTREVDDSIKEEKDKLLEPVDAILDLFRRSFPDNIIVACFEQSQTQYETEEVWENETEGNVTDLEQKKDKIIGFSVGMTSGTNVVGLVVFSVTLGIIVGRMGEDGMPVRVFVDSLQQAILQIVTLVIWLSPIGIASILAGRIVSMKDPETAFIQLGWYMMTVLVGLATHGFIFLPALYLVITRCNPYRLMLRMSKALLTALGTASSSATLPITMRCLEENAKVDPRVSKFVLPVGATINMDGTALYEAVATIFIAQINGYDLDAGQIVIISITATAAAIGAAGVPEAGLVTMVIVLTAVGLPTDDIGLIVAVDWFLDRFRTMINVWGDSVGAGIVESLCKKQLQAVDDTEAGDSSPSVLDTGNDDLVGVHNADFFKSPHHQNGFQNGVKRQEAYNPGYLADSSDINVRF